MTKSSFDVHYLVEVFTMWITKFFNKKQSEEDLLINHIKDNYDFDEVILIKKKDPDFLLSLNLLASTILENKQASLGISQIDPTLIEKHINEINSSGEYSIIKFSRKYMMTTSYNYAILSKNLQSYTIPFKYITDQYLFSTFPTLKGFEYRFMDNLIRSKSYRCLNINNIIRIIPSYSIRFPLKDSGILESYKDGYTLRNLKTTCSRDLEIIIDIETINKTINHSVKLFYGMIILKEKNVLEIPDFEDFFDDFLFPYNMKYELINELGISLPFKFTSEFLKSMDDDFKLTVDMLKI